MKIIKIKKEKKEYFIVYKKNNEIFTFNGSAEEILNELERGSNDT